METKTITTSHTDGRRLQGVALISVLAALMLTLLLEALDQTIVGMALPRIIGVLQGFDRYTWAITAYTLASTTMVPTVGKLSDQFGRKWFLIAGTTIFLLGSALAGTSQTMDQLIAFRALQGLGAGIGIALVFTVIGDLFPPAQRAKWQSILGIVYGFSSVVGPSIGGWITDNGPLVGDLVTETTRWRWVFYVNVPVGILALAALLIYLPNDISLRTSRFSGWQALRRIDFLGATLAAIATIALLLGLTWGGNQMYDWNSPQVMGALGAAGILYVLFFVAERFAVEPVLPLNLFRNQVFAAASILSLLQLMVLVSLTVYLPLFLQGVLGQSASYAGAIITPFTFSSIIGAAIAGTTVAKSKRYQAITIVGAMVMTIGVFLLTQMTPTTDLSQSIVSMVIAGIGVGFFFSVLMLASQNALPRTQLGIGTSTIRYLGQLGAVLGIAIVGTMVNSTLTTDLTNRLPASTVQQLTSEGIKYATNPQVLVNPVYRDTVVKTAESMAQKAVVAQVAANVPAGPNHDQTVAAITAQATTQATAQVHVLLDQVFDALRLSLAVAIQHGFEVILVFCALAFLTTFFLKDLPMKQSYHEESSPLASAATGE